MAYADAEDMTTMGLRYVRLDTPYVQHYDHFDEDTIRRYERAVPSVFSFGAFEQDTCVGLILAEARDWNKCVWVFEYHVAAAHRGMGIGKQQLAALVQKARLAHLRTLVCETQNTNATAIAIYRRLGFRVEGIDISYYSNDDYPDGEIAVFMKRRL